MPQGNTCTVCRHDRRKAIDAALALGKTAREVAEKFGAGQRSIERHRAAHLRPALVRAAATRTDLSAKALVDRLADLLDRCDRAMDAAENVGDLKALATLMREARELTVTVGRTVGLWTDRPQTINDNRIQIAAALDVRSLEELLAMRADLALPAANAT